MDWKHIKASILGKKNKARGLPCQDAMHVEINDAWSLAVVADGAGSASMSELGSREVCEFTSKYLKDEVLEAKIPLSAEKMKNCFLACHNHMKDYAQRRGYSLTSLSTTLIVAILYQNKLFIAHTGDGIAGVRKASTSKWEMAMNPHKGEYANETVFITMNIVAESPDSYIEIREYEEHEIDAFFLGSDGCEAATLERDTKEKGRKMKPYPNFFNPILKKLSDSPSTSDLDHMWSEFLREGTEVLYEEDDDKTLIMFYTSA